MYVDGALHGFKSASLAKNVMAAQTKSATKWNFPRKHMHSKGKLLKKNYHLAIRHTFSPLLPPSTATITTTTRPPLPICKHITQKLVIEIECICGKVDNSRRAEKKIWNENQKGSERELGILLKRIWNIQITICVSALCIFYLLCFRTHKSNIRR